MKKFRKVILALTASVYMLCLAACSDKNESGTASGQEQELQFMTNPDEPELGEYIISESGIKYYYSPDDVPTEIMNVLEKYFVAYSERDFEAYKECIHPDYAEQMEKYLQKDFGYGLQTSFEKQCDNLSVQAGGDFKITRIKTELSEEDGAKSYFETLGEMFGNDFYGMINEKSDKIHDITFFIMAKNATEETLLVSEFEIVFAEEDGKFYTFG